MKWKMSSLWGHIAVFEAIFALPLFLFFLSQTYSQGTLTVDWTIYLAILWTVLGAVGGAFFWYAVSLPLIKSRRDRK
jgi:hypothetical protein